MQSRYLAWAANDRCAAMAAGAMDGIARWPRACSKCLLCLLPAITAQQVAQLHREPAEPPSSGWKTIHVFIGNETRDRASPFYTPQDTPLSHSQVGQDLTVALLTEGRRGYFVDLASNDAIALSNTLMLERDFGWDGVCIEANSQYWSGLARRRCTVVGGVVGSMDNEVVTFTFGGGGRKGELGSGVNDPGAMGGIVRKGFDNGVINRKFGATKMHTVTLSEVLTRANAPNVIDYMSLDVEGAETFIAKDFPWHLYTVKLLTVERPDDQLKEILAGAGLIYLKTHGTFGDLMYAHHSVVEKYRAILQASDGG